MGIQPAGTSVGSLTPSLGDSKINDNDTLVGGAGDDVYYVDNLDDVIIEKISDHTASQQTFSMGNNNDVMVVSVSGYVLKAGVDVEDMMASGAYTGTEA